MGKIGWSTPVGEVFPELAPSIDAATFSEPSMMKVAKHSTACSGTWPSWRPDAVHCC